MIELSTIKLGLLIGFTILCFIGLIIALILMIRKKNRILKNMHEFAFMLKEKEKQRFETLKEIFQPYFNEEGKELMQYVTKVVESERKFYQSLVDIYGGDDIDKVKTLDDHVNTLLAPHANILKNKAKDQIVNLSEENNELNLKMLVNEEALDTLFKQYVKITGQKNISNPKLMSAQEKLDLIRKKPLDSRHVSEVSPHKNKQVQEAEGIPILKALWETYAKINHIEYDEHAEINIEEIAKHITLEKPYQVDELHETVLHRSSDKDLQQASKQVLEKAGSDQDHLSDDPEHNSSEEKTAKNKATAEVKDKKVIYKSDDAAKED